MLLVKLFLPFKPINLVVFDCRYHRNVIAHGGWLLEILTWQKYLMQTAEFTMLIGPRDLIISLSAAARTKTKLYPITMTIAYFSVGLFFGHVRSSTKAFITINHH